GEENDTQETTDDPAERPGGEKHDEDRGDAEEALHAEATAALEHEPAEDRGGHEPGGGAAERGPAGEVLELRREAPEEQHRLGALSEDAGEGDEPHHPELVRVVRGVDATLEVAVQLARVAAHPPAVAREQRDGGEAHDAR